MVEDMKIRVLLKDIVIAKAAITDNIYAGIPEKDKMSFRHKVDVTGYFVKAIVEWMENGNVSRTINNRETGESYEIYLIKRGKNFKDTQKKIKSILRGEKSGGE